MKNFRVKQMAAAVSLALTGALATSSAFAQSEELKMTNVFVMSPQEQAKAPTNQFVMDSPVSNGINNTTKSVERTPEAVVSHSSEQLSSVVTAVTAKSADKKGRLVQIGQESGNLEPLRGFAKNLPLLDVLKQITPNGWMVKNMANNQIDLRKLVSWNGGKSWIRTLEGIAQENDLYVLVSWSKKEILVGNAVQKQADPIPTVASVTSVEKSKTTEVTVKENVRKTSVPLTPSANNAITSQVSKPKQEVFELESQVATTIATGNSQAKNVEALPAPALAKKEVLAPVATPATWMLDSSKTLKENVEEFGKLAGYKVVWNGEDYPVDEMRSLAGTFDSDNGPIKQLSDDYGPKSRVQQPLTFQFFQNKTLLVENWKFEQNGYPQYGQ